VDVRNDAELATSTIEDETVDIVPASGVDDHIFGTTTVDTIVVLAEVELFKVTSFIEVSVIVSSVKS
jgi:hypothetical protein